MVDGFNLNPDYDKYGATRIFADLVDSYNIPWTFLPGNNDSEIDGENEDLIAISSGLLCLFDSLRGQSRGKPMCSCLTRSSWTSPGFQ